MISNDQELKVTMERIERFQQQVARLRQVETNPTTIDSQQKVIFRRLTE